MNPAATPLPLGELSSQTSSLVVDLLPALGSGFLSNNFLSFSAVHFSRAMHRADSQGDFPSRRHLAWNQPPSVTPVRDWRHSASSANGGF